MRFQELKRELPETIQQSHMKNIQRTYKQLKANKERVELTQIIKSLHTKTAVSQTKSQVVLQCIKPFSQTQAFEVVMAQ